MTFEFAIFPIFFEVDTEEHEEELQESVSSLSPSLYTHIKGLVQFWLSSICFNCDYFIENYKS